MLFGVVFNAKGRDGLISVREFCDNTSGKIAIIHCVWLKIDVCLLKVMHGFGSEDSPRTRLGNKNVIDTGRSEAATRNGKKTG